MSGGYKRSYILKQKAAGFCKYVWLFVTTTHLFPNLWFVKIFCCRMHPFKDLLSNEQNQRTNMINVTWQWFQFVLFSPKSIQLNKVTQSINKICNSTQLSKFVTKFYYKLFCFFLFGTAFYISVGNLQDSLFRCLYCLERHSI